MTQVPGGVLISTLRNSVFLCVCVEWLFYRKGRRATQRPQRKAVQIKPLPTPQVPGLTIRRGTVDDAALLSELGARTFSETFAADNTAEDLAAYLNASFNVAQQTAELEDPGSIFLIAEVAGRAAGYAKLHDGEPEKGVEGANPIELVRLYVLRDGLGLASERN